MNEVGISAIIYVLRGLNNSITMTRIVADLPISKSTLDRSNKDNKWPRALIISDVKNLINKYRDMYFEGQDELISREIINLLMIGNYSYEKYRDLYNNNGYDTFVNTLLNDAYTYSQVPTVEKKSNIDPEYHPESEKDTSFPEPDSFGTFNLTGKNRYLSLNWLYLFFWGSVVISLILFFGINKISITDVFSFMLSVHPLIFMIFSVLLGISTVIAGRYIDTPVAIKRYEARTGKAVRRSEKQRMEYISLYGDDNALIKGEGRFNCNRHHMIFAAFCNITSGMWAVSLFLYLNSLEHIDILLKAPYIKGCLTIAFIVSLTITFLYNYFEQNLPYPQNLHALSENPDTYIQNRANVIFNNLHLIYTLFFILSSYVIMIFNIFLFAKPSDGALDYSFILTIITAYLFLWFSSVSPYAIYFNATSTGNFVAGPLMLIVFSIFYSIKNYGFGTGTIATIFISLLILLTWAVLLHRQYIQKTYKKNSAYNSSMQASIVMISSFLMVILGIIVFNMKI